MAITKNKYTNSSGSLIAALNLTIDKAPTKPKDKANEDLTIVITIVVAITIQSLCSLDFKPENAPRIKNNNKPNNADAGSDKSKL